MGGRGVVVGHVHVAVALHDARCARAPASPVFALMAVLSTMLLGHGALARTVVVAGALPLGAWGAYRLTRTLTAALLPAVVAAVAYAANPVGRDAIARGDLGPLVCYALAPFVLHALVRAGTAGATDAASGEPASIPEPRGRDLVRVVAVVGLLGAVSGAVWPPAILLAVVIAVVLAVSVPLVGGGIAIMRTAALAVAGSVVGLLLLAPWSMSLIGADASALGLRARAAVVVR